MDYTLVKIEVFVPSEYVIPLRDAMVEAGAGRLGNYAGMCSWHEVTGRWLTLPGANPYNGEMGELTTAKEYKLEMRCHADVLPAVMETIRKNHPYEEPLIYVLPMLDV